MTIDEFIEHSIEVAEENRINASNIESNMYIPLSVDKDNLIDNCIKCAEEHEQLAKWLEELKELRELKETYAKGMETSYSEFRYKQGRADERKEWECAVADKIIKHDEDIYKALPEVIEKVRADAEKEYLLNTYGLTVKIADAEKQRIRIDVIDECINILNDSIPLVDNMDIIYGFMCAVERLEQLKENKNV